MLSEKLSLVRQLPLFKDISESAFETLTRGAYFNNFPPTTELINEGEPADFLHIVESGAVELFASWKTHETTMWTITPVSTFILAATINNRPNLMSARTIEKSRIILLPSQDVRDVFEADSTFAKAVVTELATAFRNSVRNTKNLKLRSSLERLANYILSRHKAGGGRAEFELGCEKRRLASYLGMTPENLSRSFGALASYGVSVNGHIIRINDLQDLRNFAQPTPLIDD